jgi:predicted enzyme related to lactoylglutathione lyase
MDRVCHFEIPFSDQERVTKFYQDVFGWRVSQAPGDTPYLFAMTTPVDEQFAPSLPGGINGGMYLRSDDAGSPSPVVVIEVESCEQRINRVEQAGGSKVLGPTEISGMGIYAQVKDSEENVIGLWQPIPPASP